MEREQIIKALECCHTPLASDCNDCGYRGQSVENGEHIGCSNRLLADALALIKALTKENERLRDKLERTDRALIIMDKAHNELFTKSFKIESDTVRKMHSEIKERCIKGGIYPAFVARTIDQIAKEMLEENI